MRTVTVGGCRRCAGGGEGRKGEKTHGKRTRASRRWMGSGEGSERDGRGVDAGVSGVANKQAKVE